MLSEVENLEIKQSVRQIQMSCAGANAVEAQDLQKSVGK